MIAVKRYMDGQLQNNFYIYNRYVYQKIADKLDDIFKKMKGALI